MNKMMKKIVSGALALTSVFACAGTLTACETAHPEFTMKVSFNGETYELDYYLYRNVAPATTKHFIWLVENNYYDGLCIHDYTDTRMYTGAYAAATDENDSDGVVSRNYFDFVKSSKNLASFPHSVWEDREKTMPLYTVRGEFTNNSFKVESGAFNPSFGSLTMYYASNAATDDVYVEYESEDNMRPAAYQYNSATSMFYISLENATAQSGYCTFALLQDGEASVLKALQSDIEEYIDNNYGEDGKSEFTETESLTFGVGDMLLDDYEKTLSCKVPKAAIVIESIKITKY